MSIPASDQAISRAGKPVNVGDTVSITGTVVSISGYGPEAVLVILCAGCTEPAGDLVSGVQQGVYSYTLSNTGAGTNVPASGVYAADVTNSQSL
jgi:hypothetical protein